MSSSKFLGRYGHTGLYILKNIYDKFGGDVFGGRKGAGKREKEVYMVKIYTCMKFSRNKKLGAHAVFLGR